MGLGSSSAHAYTVATHDAAATVDETPSQKIGQFFQEAMLPSTNVDPLTKVVHQNNPIEWWCQNCTHFPLLRVLAAQYMAAPLASVASERLSALQETCCLTVIVVCYQTNQTANFSEN